MTYTVDVDRTRDRSRQGELDALELMNSIDGIDAAILSAVERRTELARVLNAAEAGAGPSDSQRREEDVIAHFASLGQAGQSLGKLLIRLARADR
ncbi:chorismate mutase [Antrihabitans sp. YC2-6]|uniref:chorismate mutase n=1 Tax=Antrihabitans sp. YC2-6 TaxID=2799498 RepID=UPI0018F464CB|nr:chorismate mutase [Antrihabitans sp. YC2-6]MBJ8345837.1 chorismate mutase [Antrihabitans sp. YC2-6]